MKQHEGSIRGYHRSSKAWYAKANYNDRVSISFGMYPPDGGTTGEMQMQWQELSGKQCAILKTFEDSWNVLALFTDLIQKMGEVDGQLIQEEAFCKLLDECGFKDLTEYKDPYVGVETPKEEMVEIILPKSKAEKLGLLG